jgi:hypothetical protein
VEVTATHYIITDKAWGELMAKYRRPPEPIPDDFDPEAERRRMKQGGCCGGASRGE